jgi:hypothetical protein
MRFMGRTAAVAATVLALSGFAYAGQATPATKATAKAEKPAKAAKMTMITATGTVSKWDAASNMLTVTTAKGDVTFNVGSSAIITANGKKVASSDLSNQMGHKVTVRYSEANGQKTAESVRVSAAAAKTASAKKTSTPAKKS